LPPRHVQLALGGLIAMAVALGVGRFIYTPILPFMVEDLHLSKGAAGLIASANYAGYLIGALLSASPLLTGSRRRWLIGALATGALTTGAMGLTSSIALHLALRLVGGIASALIFVYASALVLDRLRHQGRDDLAALHFAGVGTGIAVTAAMVSALVAAGIGWRGHWIAAGLLSAAAMVLVTFLIGDEADPPSPPPKRDGTDKGLALLTLAYGLFGFGYVITATFIMAIVREFTQLQPLEPYVWIIVGLAAAPSVVLWNRIAATTGILPAFAIACLVQAVAVGASVLWVTPAGILVAAILLGGTIMGITALGLIAAQDMAGGDPRRAFALITAAFGLGQIIGPVTAGFLHDLTGSFLLATMTAAVVLVVAAGLAVSAARLR
jgi:predicted MFS family arabinose efflux permease